VFQMINAMQDTFSINMIDIFLLKVI